MKKHLFLNLVFIINFLIICFVSIGYSAFYSSLSVSGDAIVRRDADVRITNLELVDKQNGGDEKFNSEYSRNLTSMYVGLPNTNSSITYRVTVKNKSSSYFTPGDIKEVIKSNANVNYVIEGIEEYGVYQGNNYSFLIKISTSLVNQELNLILQYDFKTIDDTVWNYSCTGSSQSFTSLYTATYKIEAWGARGGASGSYAAGAGGYVSGEILLNANTPLYIHVGASGLEGVSSGALAVYNGGGRGGSFNTSYLSASGGGATDIRTESGVWNDAISLRSRIMVASGGGGALSPYDSSNGNAGGGLTGYSLRTTYYEASTGGEQTTFGICPHDPERKGSFGSGGNGFPTAGGAGGGSGYYGGAAGWGTGGGGGSSFISGHTGCVAITSESDETPKSGCISGTTDKSCSVHYSNLVFSNTKMIDGAGYSWTNVKGGLESMPKPGGGTYALGQGHLGDGYVRIAIIPKN